jgi:hypothetical protein
MPEILLKESKWFYADPFYLQQYMVELYNSYDKYKKKAEDLMNINTKKYTLGKMEDKIKIVFDENLPSFPKELELALPKLKKINV